VSSVHTAVGHHARARRHGGANGRVLTELQPHKLVDLQGLVIKKCYNTSYYSFIIVYNNIRNILILKTILYVMNNAIKVE
jgi:hypothetical protein